MMPALNSVTTCAAAPVAITQSDASMQQAVASRAIRIVPTREGSTAARRLDCSDVDFPHPHHASNAMGGTGIKISLLAVHRM